MCVARRNRFASQLPSFDPTLFQPSSMGFLGCSEFMIPVGMLISTMYPCDQLHFMDDLQEDLGSNKPPLIRFVCWNHR